MLQYKLPPAYVNPPRCDDGQSSLVICRCLVLALHRCQPKQEPSAAEQGEVVCESERGLTYGCL